MEYERILDASGNLVSVRILSGEPEEIDISVMSPELREFLVWVVKRNDWQDVVTFPNFTRSFWCVDSLEEFIDTCKATHITPHTTPAEFPYDLMLESTPFEVRVGSTVHQFAHFKILEPKEHGWRREAPFCLTAEALKSVNSSLELQELSILQVVGSQIDRTFVYVDISDFSTSDEITQLLLLNKLNACAFKRWMWVRDEVVRQYVKAEASMCIGDGYIFVFADAWSAVAFAAALAATLEGSHDDVQSVKVHFRIGVHTGPVRWFWENDVQGGGRWNYVGAGINDARRVLEAIGPDKDDVVYLSAASRLAVRGNSGDLSDGIEYMANRGRHRDKHKHFHRLYELDHVGWSRNCLAKSPRSQV